MLSRHSRNCVLPALRSRMRGGRAIARYRQHSVLRIAAEVADSGAADRLASRPPSGCVARTALPAVIDIRESRVACGSSRASANGRQCRPGSRAARLPCRVPEPCAPDVARTSPEPNRRRRSHAEPGACRFDVAGIARPARVVACRQRVRSCPEATEFAWRPGVIPARNGERSRQTEGNPPDPAFARSGRTVCRAKTCRTSAHRQTRSFEIAR